MRGRDHVGDGVQQFDTERAGAREVIDRLPLVEPRHLQRPFHHLAVAVEREAAIGAASDRHQPAIDFWRECAIDQQFLLAGLLAFLQRGVIEIRELHRALDLQRALAREKHRGAVRINSLHDGAAMNVRRSSENRRPVAACRRMRSECAVSGKNTGNRRKICTIQVAGYMRKRGGDATIAQTLRLFDPDQSNRQGRGVVDTRDATAIIPRAG